MGATLWSTTVDPTSCRCFDMIKILVLVSVLVAVVSCDQYTNKYDNVKVEDILNNRRLFENYFSCLMDRGRCTPDGAELKKTLPDALKDKCTKCTAKQREQTEKVVRHLIEKKPEQWKELKRKYDPDGKYESTYKMEADKHGIKV